MPIKGLPTSLVLDLIGDNALLLDQTTYQHIINGLPQFDEGLTVKEDKWIYLDGA